MTDFLNTSCLGSCSPTLIISLKYAVNDITKVAIYDNCGNLYEDNVTKYAYSLDGTCWSCYDTRDNITNLTIDLKLDFYVRTKVNGVIGKVQYCNQDVEYSVNLDTGFNFESVCQNTNVPIYSPYANMDTAIALQLQLSDYVACVVGIPIYYFKVVPTASSKDITFKEYCLMNVSEVKLIKLIVANGDMPSSKPMFSEFGIDFQTDWETEISKSQFATAFGVNAKPMEGDLIYIPMMKRMWMVNSAYEEKKNGFMWNATTFNVALVKYQEKDSVDLGNQEEFVASLVTQKYEELFSDYEDENSESGTDTTEAPKYAANNLYNIFESDSVRKSVSVEGLSIINDTLNQNATRIADNIYKFSNIPSTIIYQKLYCGEEGSTSFIIKPQFLDKTNYDFIHIGNIKLNIGFDGKEILLKLFNAKNVTLNMENNNIYFVYLRWSRKMNVIEMSCARYTFNERIPLYKLQPFHYFFNMNDILTVTSKYDIEMVLDLKGEVFINNFEGMITNFKLYDEYWDSIAELLLQYPTNKHIIINDTARPFVDTNGQLTKL